MSSVQPGQDPNNQDHGSLADEITLPAPRADGAISSGLEGPALRAVLLDNAPPHRIIEEMASDLRLRTLLNYSAGVREDFTVGAHTEMVLDRLQRYPFFHESGIAEARGFDNLTRDLMQLTICYHDLNKLPKGVQRTSKEEEHARAISLLESYQERLGLSDRSIKLMSTLIEAEVLGPFMKDVLPARPTTEEKARFLVELSSLPDEQKVAALRDRAGEWERATAAAPPGPAELEEVFGAALDRLTLMAERNNISPREMLYYISIFYQCDCSAYTMDAVAVSRRGIPSMEFLFARDPAASKLTDPLLVYSPEKGRLLFAESYEPLMCELERRADEISGV
jgi:hypothetical protein